MAVNNEGLVFKSTRDRLSHFQHEQLFDHCIDIHHADKSGEHHINKAVTTDHLTN